jgi:hypothetical protein
MGGWLSGAGENETIDKASAAIARARKSEIEGVAKVTGSTVEGKTHCATQDTVTPAVPVQLQQSDLRE